MVFVHFIIYVLYVKGLVEPPVKIGSCRRHPAVVASACEDWSHLSCFGCGNGRIHVVSNLL